VSSGLIECCTRAVCTHTSCEVYPILLFIFSLTSRLNLFLQVFFLEYVLRLIFRMFFSIFHAKMHFELQIGKYFLFYTSVFSTVTAQIRLKSVPTSLQYLEWSYVTEKILRLIICAVTVCELFSLCLILDLPSKYLVLLFFSFVQFGTIHDTFNFHHFNFIVICMYF
jgi:hypothetical protein